MHGLIFATWEKFLKERYGPLVLEAYRDSIAGTKAITPLVTRVYDDSVLLRGVTATARKTGIAAPALLREYGKYFITNVFTGHVCSHLLESIHCARDLLLVMRIAHKQLQHSSEAIVPPLFKYEPLTGNGIRIMYDSHRRLCPILWGAIEGAAERYKEEVAITELVCMQQGAKWCEFDVHFLKKHEVQERRLHKENDHIVETIWHMLPLDGKGYTLNDLRISLHLYYGYDILRISQISRIIMQLQNMGCAYVFESHEDALYERRYLRVAKLETGIKQMLEMSI